MTIQIVDTDDYSAIYLDGIKYDEDHSIREDVFLTILSSLGVEIKPNIYIKQKDMLEKFDEQFPNDINDVINKL